MQNLIRFPFHSIFISLLLSEFMFAIHDIAANKDIEKRFLVCMPTTNIFLIVINLNLLFFLLSAILKLIYVKHFIWGRLNFAQHFMDTRCAVH